MKNMYLPKCSKLFSNVETGKTGKAAIQKFFLFFVLVACAGIAHAQPPTSLQYPTPNAFVANVTSVYLAPTLAGSTFGLSYSVSPALPAGLSFSTATGVIYGVPVLASTATPYTITATNSFGTINKIVTIGITSAHFDNAYDSVFFNITDTMRKVGTGVNTGDVILYENVRTINGQVIDCIVTTRSITAGTTFSAYDQPLVTDGSTFNSNNPRFFSPQVTFPAGGGNIIFDFQFIAGGSYNNITGLGLNVILQNVKLNTYDIDGNSGVSSNQFNEFAGFDTSELASATTINTPVFDAITNLSKYLSNISTNSLTVTADPTRVRLTYKNMSSFSIQVGAGATGAAYFFLDFSTGPVFATAIKVTPPTLDLNTLTPGTGNGSSGCATSLAFTAASQTNAFSGTAITELSIAYKNTAANLPDGSGEQLLINGFTAGTGNYALNFSSGGTSPVTVGGVAYTVTKTVLGITNIINFKNGAGTFTLAQAEILLDALAYDNTLSIPTAGDRTFTVSFRNTLFASPNAVFTATIGCVSITGNIYHDANGLSDGIVNANGSMGQFPAAGVYAVLTNAGTNAVLATVPVVAGGAFSFGRSDPGNYKIFVSNSATPGSSVSTPTYPTGNYKSSAENLGATAGNDGLIDGSLSLILGTVNVTNANIGVQIPPVTADSVFANQPNPGGFNYYTIPAGGYKTSDIDGTVDSLIITVFPAGANYLKVGSVIYTNGGACPPQSTCTAWPGSVRLLATTMGTISIDPASTGNTTVTLNFTVIDNGRFGSNAGVSSTITIPFVVPATPVLISGNVWNDTNADGLKTSTEAYSAAASSGETLYALLIQTTNTYSGAPTILASTPVVAGATGYSFSNIPANNIYEVRIVSKPSAPAAGAALSMASPVLATNYVGVSTNNNGVIVPNQRSNNLVNILGTVNADKSNINFGIEQIPVADAKAFTAPSGAFTMNATPTIGSQPTYSINGNSSGMSGSAIKSLSGNDVEDCNSTSSCNIGKTYVIKTVNPNTLLYYNFGVGSVPVPANTTITNFDPANFTIYGQTGQGSTVGTALGFTYSLVDVASVESAPVSYSLLSTFTALAVKLVSFTGFVNGSNAYLSWQTAYENKSKMYVVEQSKDGTIYEPVINVPGKNLLTGSNYQTSVPKNEVIMYYRLKMVDMDGTFTYSNEILLRSSGNETTISVFPNPATNNVMLNGMLTASTLSIMDITGNTVMNLKNVLNNQLIDISQLSPGSYIIQVTDKKGNTSNTNLIKQ